MPHTHYEIIYDRDPLHTRVRVPSIGFDKSNVVFGDDLLHELAKSVLSSGAKPDTAAWEWEDDGVVDGVQFVLRGEIKLSHKADFGKFAYTAQLLRDGAEQFTDIAYLYTRDPAHLVFSRRGVFNDNEAPILETPNGPVRGFVTAFYRDFCCINDTLWCRHCHVRLGHTADILNIAPCVQ